MINRRTFLQAGAATSLVGASLGAPLAALSKPNSTPAGATLPYYLAIYDERLPDAVYFSRAAARLGLAGKAVRGDITDLWYSDLHVRWKQGAVPIAGFTTYGALFCLERLAWDHGMRVVYHASHTRLPDGNIAHVVAGAGEYFASLQARSAQDRHWPADVARSMAAIRAPSAGMPLPHARYSPEIRFATPGVTFASGDGVVDQPIHTWVIAPPRRG